MDFYKLERANEIRDQIRNLDTVVRCLKHSIEKHEYNSREPRYKRLFRFVNCKTSATEEEKARIFLFSGLSMHGIEIPDDQEICEKVLQILQDRLEEKHKEFAMIGSGADMRVMGMREKLIGILRAPIYPHELADHTEVVADYLMDNDVVPVVRCKDCIHWYEPDGVCLKIYSDGAVSPYAWQDRNQDDFCSYGERKDK